MSKPVAVNARSAVRSEIGGVERWGRELSDWLPRLRPDRYRVIRPPAGLAHRAGHAWEQLALPLAARAHELLLSPANVAPLAGRRNVVVIHDAAPFDDPGSYARAYGAWHRALLPRVARAARLVIVPSQFVRAELVERFSLAADRVRVVAPGVSAAFREPPDPAALRERLGLAAPYVLALGTDSLRKNLRLLDRIAPRLAEAGLEAVIAGSTRAYMRAASGHSARRLGYVPDAVLPALYAGAAAFAMPSRYEGFGLPCLEAMAAGTPVVAADRAALPEACGGAALLADPDDEEAFTGALLAAAGPERERLTAAGRERAAALTWRATAETVDALVGDLLERR